ncbi:ABC transporter permease [Cryobacterium tagatosivorans]|uniref:ABC transporter permease n=1 Tax=Cryobacterium tagatosivorans TaxID=1259199 RepID=A0A4R8UFU5_9MICO|nr:ABC transporter permease [Cryobacterium tagatosivorans]TFB51070.1 ABC transporter permease [Cryobacterium tagatosivorans]
MIRYLLGRIPSILLVIFLASIVAFILPRLAPGDPAVVMAGPDPTPEQVEAVREAAGFNRPLIEQYLSWVLGLFRGDLGVSFILNRPIGELILSRVESTLQLAGLAAVFMILLGFALGILGGSRLRRGSRLALDMFNTAMLATPPFLVALVLILVFGIWLRILPVSGEVGLSENFGLGLQYLLLPAAALALTQAAVVGRLLQTSMLTTRGEEFIDLAVAKGASPARVTFRHVLPASLDAAIVSIGLRIGELLSGAIIIEAIFARNGLGQLAVQAVNNRDYFLIQTLVIGAVVIAVLSQLISEVVMASLDPRIRLES